MTERERRLARLFRAESLLSQTEVEEKAGIDRADVANYENGRKTPPREHLELLAGTAGLTVEDGDEILALAEALRQPRRRPGRDAADLLAEMGDTCHAHRAWQRFLRLQTPDPPPAAEDRDRAREQLLLLKALPEDQRLAVVRVAWDFQTWALAEQAVLASAVAAAPREARSWSKLAVEIAAMVRGPEPWRSRVRGFALAQEARLLKAVGDPAAAAVAEEARKLWEAGEDPGGLLPEAGGLGHTR